MQQRNRSSDLYALMQEFEERERSGAITPGDFEARIEQTLRPRIGSPHTLAGEIIRAFKKEGAVPERCKRLYAGLVRRMRGHFGKRAYTDKKTGEVKKASTWSVWYDERREGDGRKQKIKGGFRTRKEAESWFNRKAEELRQGIAPRDERLTVEKYLAQWLEFLELPGSKVRGAALHAYRNHVNCTSCRRLERLGYPTHGPSTLKKQKRYGREPFGRGARSGVLVRGRFGISTGR